MNLTIEQFITIDGVERDALVSFDYTPSDQNRVHQPPSDEVDVTSCKVGGVDLLDVLKPDELRELTQRIFDNIDVWHPEAEECDWDERCDREYR